MDAAPDLRFLIPPTSENRWTDLLATFIATDPAPIAKLVRHPVDDVQREVLVRRSTQGRRGVAVRRADRLDLLLRHREVDVAAIEAKLLAPLGLGQLERYEQSFPGVARFVLHLGRFPLDSVGLRDWQGLTWETVLDAYAASAHAWVRMTASAWSERLTDLVPAVDEATRWNDVPADVTGFEVALRARMAWLHQQFGHAGHDLEHDLVVASNGGSWILRFWLPELRQDHFLTAELSEGLPSPAWKPNERASFSQRLQGPRFLVGIRQQGPRTSAAFDWDLLRRAFTGTVLAPSTNVPGKQGITVLDDRRWSTRPAMPRSAVDQQNHAAMIEAGAPAWLGQGYGMAQAKAGGACVFGARFALPSQALLGDVRREVDRTVELLYRMAEAANS